MCECECVCVCVVCVCVCVCEREMGITGGEGGWVVCVAQFIMLIQDRITHPSTQRVPPWFMSWPLTSHSQGAFGCVEVAPLGSGFGWGSGANRLPNSP